MKKKLILSTTFLMSLMPMILKQYGGCRGVQEISGMINLFNPIGILSVGLFILGVWVSFRKPYVNKALGAMGVMGIVISELYTFFTWHVDTITGTLSFKSSLSLAYPAFYFGLMISVLMVIVYFTINRHEI